MSKFPWSRQQQGGVGLYGGQFHGPLYHPGVGVAGVFLVQDTFTDSDATTLPSHTPNVDSVGNGWIGITGGSVANMEINSNQARPITDVSNNGNIIDCGTGDHTAQVDWITPASGVTQFGSIWFRATNFDNRWEARRSAGSVNFEIIERTSATSVTRASVDMGNPTNGTTEVIKVVCNGTSIAATIDGANELTHTSSVRQAVQNTGIVSFWNGTNPARSMFDNFEVTAT